MRQFSVLLALLALALAPARADDSKPAGSEWHALLVGCTEYPVLKEKLGEERYKADRIQLNGPVNDVGEMQRALTDLFQVPADHISVLAGFTGAAPERRPTYERIVAELDRLALAVKNGDRVLIHMAGHGSQVPDLDGDELDGLDECFLPCDVSSFDLKAGKVPNVLIDDELGAKVRKIRDAGAMVWLLMDCCHSGTMVRGAEESGVTMRQIDPEILGVSPAVTRGAPAEDGEALPTSEIDKKGLGSIVAMYGAPSYRPAPEMVLPRSGPREQAKPHGLLTFMVLTQLRRAGGNVTFAELHQQVLAAYEALPFLGTVPLAEGDLRRHVFGDGKESGPVLLVQAEDGTIVLNAGQFAGIVPKTVLAVYEPLKLGDPAALLGGVEVVESDALRAVCRPVELDGRTMPKLKGSMRCPARIRSRPIGDLRLKVAALDAQGRALAADRVPKAAREIFAENESMFSLVPATEAKWSLVVDGDTMWLEPGQGGQGLRFATTADNLLENLKIVFRAENLRLIAGTPGATGSLPSGLEVKVLRIDGDRMTELRSGASLRPGDKIKFVIRNGTGRIIDLALLYLDATYGVAALWPADGKSPRLHAGDKAEQVVGNRAYDVNDQPLGTERLIVVAVPREEGEPEVDLSFLEQRPLEILRRGGEESEQATLLRKLAFGGSGQEMTRGLTSEPESMAITTFVWTTSWGRLQPPKAGEGKGVVLRGGSAADAIARDAWQPESDRTTWRGDLGALYARVAPSVVVVRNGLGHGTGFVVEDGLVLTNYHVAGQGFQYTREGRPRVTIHRGALGADGFMALEGAPIPAEVVCWDPERDLALLRTVGGAGALSGMKPIPFADSGGKPGQTCVMIGHPASGLLWTVRDGHVSGVGEMPKDLVDNVVGCLALNAEQRKAAEEQLARMRQTRITLSSCPGNPGDSGGPLVDESGKLLGVTFARPGTPGEDKFVYHVHLDEVRAFLAAKPKAGAALPPEVPNPWATGSGVGLGKTAASMGGFDALLAGIADPSNPQRILVQQAFLDLDEDTQSDGSPEQAARLLESKSFDFEIAVHYLADRSVVFYDTENDGACDLVLVDFQKDGIADAQFELKDGTWTFRPDVMTELISTGHLRFLGAKSRLGAMKKLKALMAD